MKTRLWILFCVLSLSVLIFTWGSTNYMIHHTDTPEQYPDLYVRNIDVFAFPAVFAAFTIIGTIPVITYVMIKNRKLRIILVPLSGVGIFFIFVIILKFIIEN